MNRQPLPSPNSSRSPRVTNVTAEARSTTEPSQASPTARPPLQRQRPSIASQTPASTTGSNAQPEKEDESTTVSGLGKKASEDQQKMGGDAGTATEAVGKASPDEVEVERLRQLQLKMLQKQQRERMGATVARTNLQQSLGVRRVSPIKEETPPGLSPTLEASFSSPLPTGQTTSTESTESSKTIRGSVPPTPHNQPIRTPSYPFPVIPGTPRTWSSSFHQPFTTLSPTVAAAYAREMGTPRERIVSGSSTPAGSTGTFMPGAASQSSLVPEDPRFPSPSLYDLTLLLNSEPGLLAWWSAVTNIIRDWYGSERATLAVPADTSDIENVPWGQKATYNLLYVADGRQREGSSHARPQKIDLPQAKVHFADTAAQTASSALRLQERPGLLSRHSFAGHERQRKDVSSENPITPVRPRGPLRTASHMPQSQPRGEHPLRQVSQISSPSSFDGHSTLEQQALFSDPDFSSVGGDIPTGPHTAVFPVLRALDHEPDALIDNSGINRVLERGKLVTLTRDYSPSLPPSQKSSSDESDDQETTPSNRHAQASAQDPQKSADPLSRAGNVTGRIRDIGEPRLHYEEYEQFPTSPWAQSPAPSPAIQNDPTENPFFSTASVDEDTFNPEQSNVDYSQYGLVEAIGVDKASTVTHIPFIHPTLSQVMQPPESTTPLRSPGMPESSGKQTPAKADFQRRAPIAILSILSPIVPYPQNLTKSLKLLGPLLATSFSIAWQYTNTHHQATSSGHRRNLSGHQVGFAPISDQESLEELLHLDLEHMGGSTAGSMTSPSDYSGRSRHSPGGSIGGTPGWDPSAMGFSSKHSVGGTPAHLSGAEAVESYFDAKKRSHMPSSTSTSQPEQSARRHERRISQRSAPVRESAEDDVVTPRSEPKSAGHFTGKDDAHTSASRQPVSSRRPIPVSQVSQSSVDRQPHSYLHSYGADFSSSFQSLPTATTPGSRTPAAPQGPLRTPAITDAPEMPPPSTSLLRTIIDSLPVQIFTALPNTGALTWVNSKFLVYRGQESRQVLQEPWDAIHEDDRDAYLEQWNKSLRTGQQLQQKVRLRRFDNNYRWFYVRVAPLRNKRQQIVHWIGTNMDFHEQHTAEEKSAKQQQTAESEAKYRALANSSPQVVFVVSNKRGLTFCNSQWINYSGQSEIQAHGTGFLEHVHPEDVPKCRLPEMTDDGSTATNVPTSLPPDDISQDSISSGDSSETEKVFSPGSSSSSPKTLEMPQAKLSKLAGQGILKVSKDADGRSSYSTEVRLRSKDGDYRWHLVRILLENSILTKEDDEETWYGTATDINDHKLLEQTLKETMDAKSRFLSNMSHEIRTPLNGISGMVNFLLDSPLNNEQLEHINIIRSSTDSLLNLINDILDLSKVEAGMIKLSMDWLHLPSLLEEVNDLNMGLAIQKGLELNYLMEEDVPSMVKGDKFRIRQVLLNVVGNAIKFTQKGEIFVRCRMANTERGATLKENETMVRFEVIDTGSGFSNEEAKYLFKRFSQIDASSTRQHGGTGLGLAISMQFVELHGGKMDARSTPGKGSTFFFTIKFGLPSEDDRPPPETLTPSVQTPGTPALETASALPSIIAQHLTKPSPVDVSVATHNLRKERMSSQSSDQSESIKSPVPSVLSSDRSRESPSALSSGSSDPSVFTGRTSIRSERSSGSSFFPEPSLSKSSNMKLALPLSRNDSSESDQTPYSESSTDTIQAAPIQRSLSPLANTMQPPMYSILVICPLVYSREATVRHIKMTLPKAIPHQITAQPSLLEAQRMLGGDDPVLFTHVVLVLHDSHDVIAVMDQIFSSIPHANTSIVIISDPAQKKEIMKLAPAFDYEALACDRRLRFIYRPLKPSKFGIIFDPQKERESSTDRNQDSAQQVAVNQKLVFEDLKRRLGNKGHKVLLVEDNHINQTVILKFLGKVALETETVLDGVQCTDRVFSKAPDYYSIILCDLHMPNKDGYQACKEIRRWEKKNKYRHIPIVALSANVLGDVYAKCVDAGFNSYVTKPVEFKELSLVMTKFLDPADPTKPISFMRRKKSAP